MDVSEWEPPEFAVSDLTYDITSSVLEQFAQGHTIGDILRELVQNEYDARGSSLSATFGAGGLEVYGNGVVIDRAGWRRLSVMLGTGRVVGDDRDVPQKINGIGSKNHGLRSLFMVGDQIYVRSGGYQTILDLRHGALREPRSDPASADIPGAHIFVPYREQPNGLLEAYGPEREARDIELLAEELAPTLVKLAQPGAQRSLRSVMVSSVRLDRALIWRQKVKLLRRHRLGGPIFDRTIELRDGSPSSGRAATTKIVEREYQRTFDVPSPLRSRIFPDYFRVPGGRLRIGVSLRLKRKRLDLDDRGSFYYPLGFTNSSTGSAVSVSAPFEMNGDRSALIDPALSSWNEWLMERAAEFTLDLLAQEWLNAFGGDAFLAVDPARESAAPGFVGLVSSGLRERECWPTRERVRGSGRPRLRAATDIMQGASPELDVLVGDSRRLDAPVASQRVREMARKAGAKDFTVRSAVRLRCAGADASHLNTKLGVDPTLSYLDFPKALANLELQELFGRAFDVHRGKLTPDNRFDLREAPTTLTAAGTLAAPSQPLWIVDDALVAVSPVSMEQRLHPRLVQYKTIGRLCQPFDVSSWARNVASQAAERTVKEEDREALCRYLIQTPEAISHSVWPALRRAPVLRDHRGQWVSPVEMLQRRTPGASRIEAALHFPDREVARNPKLLRLLRIRAKLTGADLLRYAHIVAEHPPLAEAFEETLYQLRSLLTRPTVAKLRSIAFLRSTRGDLVAPSNAYVRTLHLLQCVGPEANVAAGPHVALHPRLGCRAQPLAEDIAAFLNSVRARDEQPEQPDVLYPALADALRAEGDSGRLAGEPVINTDGGWYAPRDVLVGKKHRETFFGAVPIIATTTTLSNAYQALGASTEPSAEHWARFFEWADERSEAGARQLSPAERRALRSAYAKLGSLPADVPDRRRVFLDTTGRLHPRSDALAMRYLINNDPRTAEAIAQSGLTISFADVLDPSTRRFYGWSGVSLLTDARRHFGIRVGERRPSPQWFQESAELDRLQRPEFASAVHAVSTANGSHTAATGRELLRRLHEIRRIIFVRELEDIYRIGSFQLDVPSDVGVEGDLIALRYVRSRVELFGLLARALAGMAEATVAAQQQLSDSIFRILMSETTAEIARYLAQRGVVWTGGGGRQDDDKPMDDDTDSRAQIAEALKENLLQGSTSTAVDRTAQPASNGDLPRRAQKPRARELPPLDVVELREAPAIDWTPGEGQHRRSAGGGGAWFPRSPAEQVEDLALGTRGEELVYREQVERVRALGYSEARVVWTSQSNPGADHDILSVDDDGGDLWLEVKSTTGRHGHFNWPRAEFELALRARERYVLCRVYEAHTATPTVRRERDPVARLLAGEMRLDISSLAAEVAPLP